MVWDWFILSLLNAAVDSDIRQIYLNILDMLKVCQTIIERKQLLLCQQDMIMVKSIKVKVLKSNNNTTTGYMARKQRGIPQAARSKKFIYFQDQIFASRHCK